MILERGGDGVRESSGGYGVERKGMVVRGRTEKTPISSLRDYRMLVTVKMGSQQKERKYHIDYTPAST